MVDLSHLRTEIKIPFKRSQYITDSPAQYAREVGFHLQHRTPLNHDILFELHHFMWGYDEEELDSHTGLMHIFIEQDLVLHLAKFAFSDDFWRMGEATNTAFNGLELMMFILLDIAYLIDAGTQLNPATVDRSRSAKITSHIQKAITLGKDNMTRFLQTLWRRRREFVFDPDYPSQYCFANGFSNWYLRLHIFCEKQNIPVPGLSYEVVPLLLCCWARTENHPTECFYILNTIATLLGENRNALGTRGVKELLNHPEETKYVLVMCIWSIRRDVVDLGLAHVFMISMNLVKLCSEETYASMHSYWVRLLTATARACERQLCSGDNESTYRHVFPVAYTLMAFLVGKEPIVSYNADGEGNLAEIDLISMLSRSSVRIAADPAEFLSTYTRTVVHVHISGAKYYVRSHNQYILPLLISTAQRCVPPTISALRQMQTTSPQVDRRRNMLLSAWRLYYSALGLREGDNTSPAERPLQVAPWQTCASKTCLCYGRQPRHKLRVCKGCYQRFYCNTKCQTSDWNKGGHAEVCERRVYANRR